MINKIRSPVTLEITLIVRVKKYITKSKFITPNIIRLSTKNSNITNKNTNRLLFTTTAARELKK